MFHPTVLPHQITAGRTEVLGVTDVPPVSIQSALWGVLSVVSIRRMPQNVRYPELQKAWCKSVNRKATKLEVDIKKSERLTAWKFNMFPKLFNFMQKPVNQSFYCVMKISYRTRMEKVLMSLSSWSNRAMDWMIMLSTLLTLNLTLALE